MVKKYRIIWSIRAKDSLEGIIKYIRRDSVKAAAKVKTKIIYLVNTLSTAPEKFAKERFLENEPGNNRSVVVWSYKIIYEVTTNEVIVLDIFHTSRNPDELMKKYK